MTLVGAPGVEAAEQVKVYEADDPRTAGTGPVLLRVMVTLMLVAWALAIQVIKRIGLCVLICTHNFQNPYLLSTLTTCSVPSPTCSVPSPTCSVPSPTCSVPSPTCSVPSPTCSVPSPTCSVPSPTCSVPSPTRSIPSPTCSVPSTTCSVPSPTCTCSVPAQILYFRIELHFI